jgi:hypothetical protein
METIAGDGESIVLDHMVVVVDDLEAAVEMLSLPFGTPALIDGGEALGYRRAVFRPGSGGLRIEVCQPLSPDEPGGMSQASTAFRRRLDRSGSGFHSLAFSVANLGRARELARAGGATVIESEHSESFFLHPATTCGLLVQFLGPADLGKSEPAP